MEKQEKIDIYGWKDKILGLYYKELTKIRHKTARQIKELRKKYDEMNKGQTELPETKKKNKKIGGKKDGSRNQM